MSSWLLKWTSPHSPSVQCSSGCPVRRWCPVLCVSGLYTHEHESSRHPLGLRSGHQPPREAVADATGKQDRRRRPSGRLWQTWPLRTRRDGNVILSFLPRDALHPSEQRQPPQQTSGCGRQPPSVSGTWGRGPAWCYWEKRGLTWEIQTNAFLKYCYILFS